MASRSLGPWGAQCAGRWCWVLERCGDIAGKICCSSLPGDTCLGDVPRGVTDRGAEPRGAQGAWQRVA